MAEPVRRGSVAAELGLGEAWAATLSDLGLAVDGAAAWRRRVLAQTENLSTSDLRVVALRMQGLGPAAIRARSGRRVYPDRLRFLSLAVALRFTHDDAGKGWRLHGAGRTAHRLVRDGLPPIRRLPRAVEQGFNEQWLAGRPVDAIRRSLGISAPDAHRLAAAAAPRWVGRDVAQFLGWSRENHRLRLARGRFPQPDGRDGRSDWWWPATVTEWAQQQGFTECDTCGARVVRLKQHRTKHRRHHDSATTER